MSLGQNKTTPKLILGFKKKNLRLIHNPFMKTSYRPTGRMERVSKKIRHTAVLNS